jgi:hypothetical protein
VSSFAYSHEVHFRKRIAPLFSNVVIAGMVIFAGQWTGRRRWALIAAAVPLALALIDIAWSWWRPLLTLTPWSLTHRPGLLQGTREISQAEVHGWRLEKKNLILEFSSREPLKIGLGGLSDDARAELARLLETFGYRPARRDDAADSQPAQESG